MKATEYWDVFEQTGSVDAYLLYACSIEKTQADTDGEGDNQDESGKYSGDGTFCRAGGGV